MYIPEVFAAENLAWAHKIMAAHAKLAPQYQLTYLFPHLQKKGDTLKCLPFLYGTAFLHGAIPDGNNLPHRLDRQPELPRQSSYILCLNL